VIPEIERRTGATFKYVPVLLGGVFKMTGNVSPMVANQGIKNKGDYQQLEFRRFIAKHGLTKFKWNANFPVNTLAIMRGAAAAQIEGTERAYANAVFRNMWEEGLKMDDPAVITAAFTGYDLDAAMIMARCQDAAVKDRLMKNTESSVARGTFGSPTFFVGSEMYFGKDRLPDVEAEIIKQRKT
jgi:2-hydroxychromene-2-carboxylate isomerase